MPRALRGRFEPSDHFVLGHLSTLGLLSALGSPHTAKRFIGLAIGGKIAAHALLWASVVSKLPSFLFKDDVCNVLKGGVKERQLVNKMLGSLVTESLAVWAARARHLFSVAAMPAFSVASRPSVLYAFDLIELNGDDPQRDPLEVQ